MIILKSSAYGPWVLRVQGGFAHVFLGLLCSLPSLSSTLFISLDWAWVSLGVFVGTPEHRFTFVPQLFYLSYYKTFPNIKNSSYILTEIRIFSVERDFRGPQVHHSRVVSRWWSAAGSPLSGEVAGAIFGPSSCYTESMSAFLRDFRKLWNTSNIQKMLKMWHLCSYHLYLPNVNFCCICSRNLFKKRNRVLNTGNIIVLQDCLDWSSPFHSHVYYRIKFSHDFQS